MSQLNYNLNQRIAFAGLKVNGAFDYVESFAAEEEIAFGLGLKTGTDPLTQVLIPTTDADTFRGIALHQHNANGKYLQYDTVNVLRRGLVWVEIAASVTIDTPAYVLVAGATGKFTGVSASNLATGAIFRKSVTYDGTPGVINIAPVEINLP